MTTATQQPPKQRRFDARRLDQGLCIRCPLPAKRALPGLTVCQDHRAPGITGPPQKRPWTELERVVARMLRYHGCSSRQIGAVIGRSLRAVQAFFLVEPGTYGPLHRRHRQLARQRRKRHATRR